MIVADTNVVSELMRPEPDGAVVSWLDDHATDELRITAVTLAEILHGIARLPTGRRKRELRATADDVFGAFAEGILPFDGAAAAIYADIVDRRERAGVPISAFDAQIAAICRSRRASLATRNVRDFNSTGVTVLNPWDGVQR